MAWFTVRTITDDERWSPEEQPVQVEFMEELVNKVWDFDPDNLIDTDNFGYNNDMTESIDNTDSDINNNDRPINDPVSGPEPR